MIKVSIKTKLLRLSAALLSFLVFIQQTPLQVFASAETTVPAKSVAHISQIKLNSEIGKVADIYQTSGDRSVVLIQDAHAIPDAQNNIRKIIGKLKETTGIDLIALEGASEKLDPQFFQSFPDKKKMAVVAQDLMNQGELTGVVADAMFDRKATAYVGLEDLENYVEAISLYHEAMRSGQENYEVIEKLKQKNDERKKKAYSTKLQRVDQLISQNQVSAKNLSETLTELAKFKQPKQGSIISLILSEMAEQEEFAEEIDSDLKAIAVQALKKLKQQQVLLNKLNRKKQAYLTGEISAGAFALFLVRLDENEKLNLTWSPIVKNSAYYQSRIERLEGTQFNREYQAYTQMIKADLFENEEQRKIDGESDAINIIERLAKLELTFEDWDNLDANLSVLELIQRNTLLDSLAANLDFYRSAVQRDEILFNNLIDKMKSLNEKQSIVVVGGFHTDGLIRKFKANQISYALITPAIQDLPEKNLYRDQMTGAISWKNYLKVENGKVDVFSAFARAMRDRLLADSAERIEKKEGQKSREDNNHPRPAKRYLLKLWRDQLIIDLSKTDQVQNSSSYTHYLDELGYAKNDYAAKWHAKIDQFVNSLSRLQSKSELTQKSILTLLNQSKVLQALGALPLQRGKFTSILISPTSVTPEIARNESRTLTRELAVAFADKIRHLSAISLPGAGKGTLLKRFIREVNALLPEDKQYVYIETGAWFRKIIGFAGQENVDARELEGEQRQAYEIYIRHKNLFNQALAEIHQGRLVRNETTNIMLAELLKLSQYQAYGVIWDGYPRNESQLLDVLGGNLKINDQAIGMKFLILEVDKETAKNRLVDRGERGSGRHDDSVAVVEKRLNSAFQDTLPVINRLKQNSDGVLVLDGSKSADDVYQDFLLALNGLFEKKLRLEDPVTEAKIQERIFGWMVKILLPKSGRDNDGLVDLGRRSRIENGPDSEQLAALVEKANRLLSKGAKDYQIVVEFYGEPENGETVEKIRWDVEEKSIGFVWDLRFIANLVGSFFGVGFLVVGISFGVEAINQIRLKTQKSSDSLILESREVPAVRRPVDIRKVLPPDEVKRLLDGGGTPDGFRSLEGAQTGTENRPSIGTEDRKISPNPPPVSELIPDFLRREQTNPRNELRSNDQLRIEKVLGLLGAPGWQRVPFNRDTYQIWRYEQGDKVIQITFDSVDKNWRIYEAQIKHLPTHMYQTSAKAYDQVLHSYAWNPAKKRFTFEYFDSHKKILREKQILLEEDPFMDLKRNRPGFNLKLPASVADESPASLRNLLKLVRAEERSIVPFEEKQIIEKIKSFLSAGGIEVNLFGEFYRAGNYNNIAADLQDQIEKLAWDIVTRISRMNMYEYIQLNVSQDSKVLTLVPMISRSESRVTGVADEIQLRINDGIYYRDPYPENAWNWADSRLWLDLFWQMLGIVVFDSAKVPYDMLANDAKNVLGAGYSNYEIHITPGYYVEDVWITPNFRVSAPGGLEPRFPDRKVQNDFGVWKIGDYEVSNFGAAVVRGPGIWQRENGNQVKQDNGLATPGGIPLMVGGNGRTVNGVMISQNGTLVNVLQSPMTRAVDGAEPGQKHALHGFTDKLPWKVLKATQDSITFVIRSRQVPMNLKETKTLADIMGEFELRQTYSVKEGVLSSQLEVQNLSKKEIVFGGGYHPFYQVENIEDWTIQIPAKSYWTNDAIPLPHDAKAKGVAGTEFDFNERRSLRYGLELVLSDFTPDAEGNIVIKLQNAKTQEEKVITFSANAFPHMMLWVPPAEKAPAPGIFSIEPLFSIPNGRNLYLDFPGNKGVKTVVIPIGATHIAEWSFKQQPLVQMLEWVRIVEDITFTGQKSLDGPVETDFYSNDLGWFIVGSLEYQAAFSANGRTRGKDTLEGMYTTEIKVAEKRTLRKGEHPARAESRAVTGVDINGLYSKIKPLSFSTSERRGLQSKFTEMMNFADDEKWEPLKAGLLEVQTMIQGKAATQVQAITKEITRLITLINAEIVDQRNQNIENIKAEKDSIARAMNQRLLPFVTEKLFNGKVFSENSATLEHLEDERVGIRISYDPQDQTYQLIVYAGKNANLPDEHALKGKGFAAPQRIQPSHSLFKLIQFALDGQTPVQARNYGPQLANIYRVAAQAVAVAPKLVEVPTLLHKGLPQPGQEFPSVGTVLSAQQLDLKDFSDGQMEKFTSWIAARGKKSPPEKVLIIKVEKDASVRNILVALKLHIDFEFMMARTSNGELIMSKQDGDVVKKGQILGLSLLSRSEARNHIVAVAKEVGLNEEEFKQLISAARKQFKGIERSEVLALAKVLQSKKMIADKKPNAEGKELMKNFAQQLANKTDAEVESLLQAFRGEEPLDLNDVEIDLSEQTIPGALPQVKDAKGNVIALVVKDDPVTDPKDGRKVEFNLITGMSVRALVEAYQAQGSILKTLGPKKFILADGKVKSILFITDLIPAGQLVTVILGPKVIRAESRVDKKVVKRDPSPKRTAMKATSPKERFPKSNKRAETRMAVALAPGAGSVSDSDAALFLGNFRSGPDQLRQTLHSEADRLMWQAAQWASNQLDAGMADVPDQSVVIAGIFPTALAGDADAMKDFLEGYFEGLDTRVAEIFMQGHLPKAFQNQLSEMGILGRTDLNISRPVIARSGEPALIPLALFAEENAKQKMDALYRPIFINDLAGLIRSLKTDPNSAEKLKWLGKLTSRAEIYLADLSKVVRLKENPVLLKAELLKRLGLEGFDLITFAQQGPNAGFGINAVLAEQVYAALVRQAIETSA